MILENIKECRASRALWLRKAGLSPRAQRAVVKIASRNLGIVAPLVEVSNNRHFIRGQTSRRLHSIRVPIRAMEGSRAFAIYAIVHQVLHLIFGERCNECGWRGAVHGKLFHTAEEILMRDFGVKMIYRPQNHQCELQDLDGAHICDGLGQ